MTAKDYAEALAMWVAYATLTWLFVWGALRVTRQAAKWQRRALVSLVLAVLFAPSVVGGGHGGGIGPAWVALFQMFPLKLGVLPILVAFVVFFVLASAVSWLKGDNSTKQ